MVIGSDGTCIIPGIAGDRVRRASHKVISRIVVATDDQIVGLLPAQIVSQKGIIQRLTQVVLAPVGPVEVEVDIPSMRIEVPHVHHRVIHKTSGHVEATIKHIL